MKGYISKGRAAGTWYLRVELPRSVDGSRKQRREAFRGTKTEAQRRLRDFLNEVETGGHADTGRMTVADLSVRWLAATKHRVGTRGFTRYSQLAQDYIVPSLGSLRLERLRPDHIEGALATWRAKTSKVTGRHLTPRSIRHTFDVCKGMFRWAVRMGLLVRNPCDAVDTPRFDHKEMRALDTPGVEKLLEAARGTELELPIIVFIGTGLRRGEAFGLRWSDIDFEAERLTVRRSIEVVKGERREKSPKTVRSARTIALAPFVVEALRRQKREQLERRLFLGLGRDDAAYVFDRTDGKPWNPDQFSWRFADLVRRAGIPKVRLHDLRHSYASLSLAAGTDLKIISTSLGHSTIAVTANLYMHVTESLKHESAAKLERSWAGLWARR
jgi:integrase